MQHCKGFYRLKCISLCATNAAAQAHPRIAHYAHALHSFDVKRAHKRAESSTNERAMHAYVCVRREKEPSNNKVSTVAFFVCVCLSSSGVRAHRRTYCFTRRRKKLHCFRFSLRRPMINNNFSDTSTASSSSSFYFSSFLFCSAVRISS